ncbi:hypothetical protein B0J13DRAFT_562862 [Dactylonectria estremocensis]|uniref:Uncharacterized protein n=1 Tax=Dactylonectria estremocensis TaxID=1079267 RepID=A0A9P9E7W1_9HYPO|nr:hypothetical protein B0J13DRAFT_562862 [Dactylonectria estremocensis]
MLRSVLHATAAAFSYILHSSASYPLAFYNPTRPVRSNSVALIKAKLLWIRRPYKFVIRWSLPGLPQRKLIHLSECFKV